MRNIGLLLTLILSACSTPKTWIETKNDRGGTIAYESYDPSKDNNARINELIWCPEKKHKLIKNGVRYSKSEYSATFSRDQDLDEAPKGAIETGFYQFECL